MAKETVLVVEYGPIVKDDKSLQMPSKGNPFPTQYMFPLRTTPQQALNGRVGDVPASNIAGGGSAINAMFHDRGAKADYDAWAELGNTGWDWNGLLPYFKKAVRFTPPSQAEQQKYGYTYDLSAYGGSGPVDVSYPPFQFPGNKIQFDAWKDLNIKTQKEGANGNAFGVFWVPSSQDPVKETRVDAVIAHYKQRKNYHLLTMHQASKINFVGTAAAGVTVKSRETGKTKYIVAVKEIILAAGAVHTPQLLQLSGIGPKSVLSAAGVTTKVDLEGVGQNLQDHPFFPMAHQFTSNVFPYPELLTENATYRDAAYAEYWATRTGPFALGLGNAGAFVPLLNLTSQYKNIASTLSSQSASTYVDPSTPASVLKGYAAQLKILANRFTRTDNAVMELPFAGQASPVVAFLKPASRGTIKITNSDIGTEPAIDTRTIANPVDLKIMMELLKFARKYFKTPTMSKLGPVELLPGPDVDTDAEIEGIFRAALVQPSFYHVCCTAAMGPRANGGVVGTNLLVHGVSRLSVVDASVMPMVPGTHTCETVYAIAEKAADIIKSRA
ncbi:GMC oxidoreductase [Sporormia fimetaria CBS 119925]|uniref:GMC oxidoreductase n=1 Tax=Sporormia fimetaria CBS 119925 TaxID=1340428 RepID=A0A6A6VGD5_9PLEO|nr:GMC oxidoreductase [Sporormia fimetaria CBS 119925]